MTTEPTVESRIVAHLERAHADAAALDDLATALSLRPDPGCSAPLRSRVESAVLAALLGSYRSLALLAWPLHDHWPEAFSLPAVRSAIHLAIELDRLPPDELSELLRALLDCDDRFEELLRHPERLTLLNRMRLAALCGAIALGERSTEAGTLLRGERAVLYDHVLNRLFRDRDPAVGVRAAWAVGLRLSTPGTFGALEPLIAEPSHAGARGQHTRRGLAVRTAMFVLGSEKERDADYLEELRTGLCARDATARIVVVRALRLALAVAPEVAAGLVEELLEGGSADLLSQAAEVALAIPDVAHRTHLLGRIGAIARAEGVAAYPPLRFALGPRSVVGEVLFEDLLALRRAAEVSPQHACDAAVTVLGRLVAPPRGDGGDDLEQACETLLFDSTLLREALGAAPTGERRAHYRAYAEALAACRQRRLRDVQGEAADEDVARAHLWRLTRALDASPRRGRDDEAEPDPVATALGTDAVEALGALLRRACDDGLGGVFHRPLAIAMITAAELSVGVGALAWTDVLAGLLAVPAGRLLRHCAAATTVSELGETLQALVDLRATLDDHGRAAARTDDRPSLVGRSLMLSAQALSLASRALLSRRDDPVWLAMARVVRVIAEHARATGGSDGRVLLVDLVEALEAFGALARHAEERFGLRPWQALSSDDAGRAARPLLQHAGLLLAPEAGDFGLKRARKAVMRAAPPSLAPLFEVLFGTRLPSPTASRSPSAEGPYSPGRRVGDYVVVRPLGAGGMGWCVLVRRRLEAEAPNVRHFVLKVPRDERGSGLFREEARTLIELSKHPHPAVVRFIGFIDYGYRLPVLLMEYVPGQSLGNRIEARQLLSPPAALELGRRMAEALAHCHGRKVTHQDLKPDNIILREGEAADPVLVDWGLAGAGTVRAAGTYLYMAPERWDQQGPALSGAPADVFALGCVLYEAVVGRELMGAPVEPADFPDDTSQVGTLNGIESPLRHVLVPAALARAAGALSGRVRRAFVGERDGLVELLCRMVDADPARRPTAREVAGRLRELTSAR